YADTRSEHPDLHRWNADASADLGVPITTVCDGRTVIEANRAEKWLGNSRFCPASRLLKLEPTLDWLQKNSDPHTDILYVGIGWSETHRIPGSRAGWLPWRAEYPMAAAPWMDHADLVAAARSRGLVIPELYRRGFPRNNCFGACVKAGAGQWLQVLREFPDVFWKYAAEEEAFRSDNGNAATYLTEVVDGVTLPLPLHELARRAAERPEQIEVFAFDWGGCGCMEAAS
ncbi:hypothetical protein, partial [Embleya sp. NPDC001921]